MRAWGGGSGGRWGDDDSYGERELRQGREGDRLRSERKTQDGEKWTPEREKQGRWQEERSIKGGQQKRQTRSHDDREEERGTPRSMTSGQRASKGHDRARKDAGKTGKAENQEGARKVAPPLPWWCTDSRPMQKQPEQQYNAGSQQKYHNTTYGGAQQKS